MEGKKPTLTEQVKALTERVEKLEKIINHPGQPPHTLSTPLSIYANSQQGGFRDQWRNTRWPDPKL